MIVGRDYQIDAVAQAMIGSRRPVIVSPTGSGKTTMAGLAAQWATSSYVLTIAHRRELCDQMFDRLGEFGFRPGMICESSSRVGDPRAFLNVSSIQTLVARGLRPRADLILYDECHHAPAAHSSALLEAYPEARIIGFTATPERSDGQGLDPTFDRIIVAATAAELVKRGLLVRARIAHPGRRIRPGQIAQKPVDAYLKHADTRQAIVFAASRVAAEQHAKEFNDAGIVARVIRGDMPTPLRDEVIEGYRLGVVDVLVSVNCLTEGFDAPATSCVILARSFGTLGGYLQAIGRGLRPFEGKTDCIVLDLYGASTVWGHPEDAIEYSLVGRGVRRPEEQEIDDQTHCRVCGAPTTPGEACGDCGTEPHALKPPKVAGVELVPYEDKRKEPLKDRVWTLVAWMKKARNNGYKAGWVRGRYRAVYGTSIPEDVKAAAIAILSRRVH